MLEPGNSDHQEKLSIIGKGILSRINIFDIETGTLRTKAFVTEESFCKKKSEQSQSRQLC